MKVIIKLAAMLLPVGVGLVSLGIGRVLRFWRRLTQLLFGLSPAGGILVALLLLRLLPPANQTDSGSGALLILTAPVLLSGLWVCAIRVVPQWLRNTRAWHLRQLLLPLPNPTKPGYL